MLVLLAPGQGSQTPGLLLPWLDQPGARARLADWSTRTGLDLVALGTTGTAEDLRDTAVTQPLLTAAALLSARALLGDDLPGAACGHSVGELSALAVAGVITDEEAVSLAAGRGAAMARAAAAAPTGMVAVLGGDAEEVLAAAQAYGLSVATVNVAGQVVLGGPVVGLDALAAAPPTRARVRRLDVAGAFHTPAMAPAALELADLLARITPRPAGCPVVANADGEAVTDGPALVGRLAVQLTGPVRFDRCLAGVADLGATAVVELAPGGTLAALAKRALPGLPTVALRTPDDLAAARDLLGVAA